MLLSVKTLVREPSAQNSLCLCETRGAARPLLRTPTPDLSPSPNPSLWSRKRSAHRLLQRGCRAVVGLCSKHQTLTVNIFSFFLDCLLVSQPDVKVLAGRNHICIFSPAPPQGRARDLGIACHPWGKCHKNQSPT